VEKLRTESTSDPSLEASLAAALTELGRLLLDAPDSGDALRWLQEADGIARTQASDDTLFRLLSVRCTLNLASGYVVASRGEDGLRTAVQAIDAAREWGLQLVGGLPTLRELRELCDRVESLVVSDELDDWDPVLRAAGRSLPSAEG
jgi:hypothetical protein